MLLTGAAGGHSAVNGDTTVNALVACLEAWKACFDRAEIHYQSGPVGPVAGDVTAHVLRTWPGYHELRSSAGGEATTYIVEGGRYWVVSNGSHRQHVALAYGTELRDELQIAEGDVTRVPSFLGVRFGGEPITTALRAGRGLVAAATSRRTYLARFSLAHSPTTRVELELDFV